MKIALEDIKSNNNIDFLARQLVEGFITGLHKSPYHGFSVEFSEHRLYNAGESTRHIDWKVFARTDRIYTKRYEEETNLRCQIIIDNSSSMYYPAHTNGKIRFSVLAAASLAYLLQHQRDAVGLCAFSDEIELLTPIKSASTHLNFIIAHLQSVFDQKAQRKGTDISKILHEIARKIHRRSLIILFSDMFDNPDNHEKIFESLQHLKHNRHEVLLFHVTDPETEREFAFDDRPYEFVDLETGEKLRLRPDEIRADYKRQASKYYSDLKNRCAQLKIDFIEADSGGNYNDILRTYLIKRSRMR